MVSCDSLYNCMDFSRTDTQKSKKVALFAHNWHWLVMNERVMDELREHNVDFSLFILRHPDNAYFDRLKAAQQKYPALSGFKKGSFETALVRFFAHIPFIGELASAYLVYRHARRFLRLSEARALIITDDRALFYPLAALRAAASLKIPTVLFPAETLMLVSGLEQDKAASMSGETFLRKFTRDIVKKHYPKSVRVVNGREAHFYSPRRVLPFLFWPSFLPTNPWVRGSNEALSLVAVNSKAQFEENAIYGILPERMSVTGFPPHDSFVASTKADKNKIRTAFAEEFNAPNESKVFLVAGTHFRSVYDASELPAVEREVKEVFQKLCEKIPEEYLMVVKLHPNTEAKQWIDYFGKQKRRIVFVHREWDAYRLLAIADSVFMFASSIVMAGLATNVPIWAYKLRLPSFEAFFKPYRSITLLNDVASLDRELAKFTGVLSSDMREKREKDRAELGMFDGKSAARFYATLEKILTA